MKRLIDFASSTLILIVSVPVILITSVAIKLESRGPVFFRQERVGKDGKVFLKYKVKGTTTSPKPTLVEPTVPPLQALLKEMGGDVADIAKEAAKKEAEKAIDDATKQLGNDLRKKFSF